MKKDTEQEIERNLIFIGTIYDTFEALEETLGKMQLEEPLFLTYIAKRSFANAIFNHVKENNERQFYINEDTITTSTHQSLQ